MKNLTLLVSALTIVGCVACSDGNVEKNSESSAPVVVANDSTLMTYQEVFNAIDAMPNTDGVAEADTVDRQTPLFEHLIHNVRKTEKSGETYRNTAFYGNAVYALMGHLPASEMIKGYLDDQTMFMIFAKPVVDNQNEVLILFDSARTGKTAAIFGETGDRELNCLRKSTISTDETGRVTLSAPVYIL